MFNRIKGDNYEKFIVKTLKNEFDDVWLWKDVPESILIQNKIINDYGIYSEIRKDIGIDIIAVKDGICEYIQCKNYEENICIKDISGFLFFMIMKNVNGTICYSNGISKNIIDSIKDSKEISKLKIKLRHIPINDDIDIHDNNKIKKNQFQPRYYQLEAIDIINNEKNQKIILSMPCGTGKTFTVSMVANNYKNVIVVSPLCKLTSDLLNMMSNFLGINYKKILISSEGTRNIAKLESTLGYKNIIGCTYDSVDVLNEIYDKLNNTIIIIDEYHNLSQKNLQNKNNHLYKLLCKNCKIVYMSATPNLSIIHDAIYKYNWNDAINDGYICDFNITIPTLDIMDDNNLNRMLELLKNINNINEKMIKKGYFIVKSLLYNGNRKCIIYLTTIDKANIFKNVLEGLMKLLNIELNINVIINRTNKRNRDESIYAFKNSQQLSILINVHILDEGIDIPECDSVFITQPNNNIANLIQRMCRCNRVIENKKKCNMYIWCTDKKIQQVMNYIKEKTTDNIKVNKYDSNKNIIIYTDNKNIIKNDSIIKEDKFYNEYSTKLVHVIDKKNIIWYSMKDVLILLGYKDKKNITTRFKLDKVYKIYYSDIQICNDVKNQLNLQPKQIFVNIDGIRNIMNNSTKQIAKTILESIFF